MVRVCSFSLEGDSVIGLLLLKMAYIEPLTVFDRYARVLFNANPTEAYSKNFHSNRLAVSHGSLNFNMRHKDP